MNNLQQGSTDKNRIMQVQQFLQGLGLYNGAIDGIFGPKTSSAVQQFQQQQNIKVDGIIGPITQSKIDSYGAKQQINNDPNVQAAIANDPTAKATLDALNASGDMSADHLYSYAVNYAGQPFSAEDFNKSYQDFYDQSKAYYDELQTYDKGSIENALGLNQRNYDRYLADSAAQFGQDKNAADSSAADRGVLFSTSRKQDLTNLQNKYQSDQASKADAYRASATNSLLDYQNKYGANATSALSKYGKIGGQTYNAFIPGGQTQSTGLSSFFSPSSYNLTGTTNADRVKNAAILAGYSLGNQVNKKSLAGYGRQY